MIVNAQLDAEQIFVHSFTTVNPCTVPFKPKLLSLVSSVTTAVGYNLEKYSQQSRITSSGDYQLVKVEIHEMLHLGSNKSHSIVVHEATVRPVDQLEKVIT